MRVSTQQTYTSMTQSFNNLSSDLTHVVTQMATGKSIILPSDDPIAATRITQLNRQQSAISQYQDNIDTASAGLSQQESILDGVNNDLLSVRDDLLQAANGTNTADSLASLGQDIQSLTTSMVAALNYQDEDGHYVFGGTVNDQPPIVAVDDDGDGVTDSYTYQGNGNHREATVSNGVEVDTNVAVSDFFGSNLDVLNTLTSLSNELMDPTLDPSDPQVQSDISSAVDVVDSAADSLNASIASIGETQNTMSMLSDAQTDISTSNDQLLGQLSDLDYGPASITFTGLEMAMEATLKTYSKVSELNLFSVI
ncbi:TPA: flagellar hook-associated protein FlgL [Kluyvera ascorbata F0526]|jgi:flagellar hook-associated protein 3 FlgL|uniref:Flagellar hook-associated protein FlgL n=1 Tax=Kluyvera ascorbata TaxID=51288 RepID=A0AB35XE86_9ENTR|nr:flagellar hook-associated protein FlgL [Kluyvera ascorbata]HEB4875636.1 flagellar hook-associated protein FlgL [Kluyvera ascorbata F0526]MDT8702003.1 flagellar hook-associated protein FlgL [Kluyvera ascorbata]HDG1667866.1 flagellar hook-associated protein FlgL [Kluyvera ascorbata]HDG1670539.1 flagellar hook-associated protein FlgL [Kluyvera ascorbata]HDG1708631.1 flagellar hook-associated protein FlgL [Kluyvera ascorbata]